jgi:organic hydroperoxide reductase OsmC/OhrA
MSQSTDVLYTARTHATDARANGVARSSEGQLDIRLSTPGTGQPRRQP